MKKFLLGTLAVIVVVAGCTAASHLKALRPKPIPASPPLTVPSNKAIHPPKFQAGIAVDAYTSPKQDFSSAAEAVIAYAKSLNANSLSITFPFFISGPNSSRVYATSRTPTPTELALFVTDAEKAGLFVSLRPLLSEGNLGLPSRTLWRPADPAAWFASYRHFLMPYAQMAQANKVGEFFVGVEFELFGNSPRWNGLDRALAKVFHGELAYSNNDAKYMSRSTGGRQAYKAVDAYHPINPPFLHGWESWIRQWLPTGTVLTEVSIAAINGAWRRPWVHRAQPANFNPLVQARWFTAACHAAINTRLGGIYFWAVPFSTRFKGPTLATPGAWAHSAGSAAIKRCFGTVK